MTNTPNPLYVAMMARGWNTAKIVELTQLAPQTVHRLTCEHPPPARPTARVMKTLTDLFYPTATDAEREAFVERYITWVQTRQSQLAETGGADHANGQNHP